MLILVIRRSGFLFILGLHSRVVLFSILENQDATVMSDVNSFFSSNNTVSKLSHQDLSQTANYIKVIEAFARTSNQSIYVIDYQKKGFEYVSNNPLFLNGHTAEEVLAMGYEFYFKYVPADDLELLLKINTVGFAFYDQIPEEERSHYSISYDFHIQNREGNQILIHQKLTPIYLTESGKIWKALCIVSLSTHQKSGNITISKEGSGVVHCYDLEKAYWQKIEQVALTEREKEIIQYSIRGYSITEIGEKVFLSPDTVKFHRRKIFEKLEVNSITEAILMATNLKIV